MVLKVFFSGQSQGKPWRLVETCQSKNPLKIQIVSVCETGGEEEIPTTIELYKHSSLGYYTSAILQQVSQQGCFWC